jgi:hypothetical protein
MSDRPSPIKLNGALVGGPNQQDFFPDIRNDYKQSEVAMDYNGGYTGLVAGLAALTQGRSDIASTCNKIANSEWLSVGVGCVRRQLGQAGEKCVMSLECTPASCDQPGIAQFAGFFVLLSVPPVHGAALPLCKQTTCFLACLLTHTLPCPHPAATAPNTCKRVEDFTQCGGMGDTCPSEYGGSCIDGPWKNHCCPRGQTCQKRNQWFWICTAAVPPPY